MKKVVLIAAVSTLFSGCASVLNETTHPIKIEAKTAGGQLVAGAQCKARNDYGFVEFTSGATVQVHRSGNDLEISCTHPDNPEAKGRAISRANGGMFGNILLGGGIGALIDHNRGTAYTYPTWMQVVFGQEITFDRSNEKENEPVAGMPDVAAK